MLLLYKLFPGSPIMTPLMSDTFFGHFCWALKYRDGTTNLTRFLESYSAGRSAPVLFSCAFPNGFLPRPTLPPPNIKLLEKLVMGSGSQKVSFEALQQLKAVKKIKFFTEKIWGELSHSYSEPAMWAMLLKIDSTALKDFSQSEVVAGNTISRIDGTVIQDGGGLFHREKTWVNARHSYDLYVEINNPDYLESIDWFFMEYLPETGFGADKSVGMGSLVVEKDLKFDESRFAVKNPNARLSLSLAAFQGIHEIPAFYRLKTKLPKLGGDFASYSPSGGNVKPYKKRILMYEPGAVFLQAEPLSNKPLLNNVHTDERIRHCGIPVTLPFHIKEIDEYESIAI